MKQLTERQRTVEANAWGRDQETIRQRFLIEESDVGRSRDHYLGHNHRTLTFTRADVGKTIEVMHYSGYTSWAFINS